MPFSWNDADANDDSPIHYAASRTSSIIIYINRNTLHIDVDNTVAQNGSNAYHIAALTGQCAGMYALTDNLQIKTADVKDVLNIGIMDYVCDQTDTLPAASAAELVPNVLGFLSFGAY